MQQSTSVLERFYNCLKGLDIASAKSLTNSRFEKAFFAAMDDDFNTPEAISVLFEMVKEINKNKETDSGLANQLGALLVRLANLLGILQSTPEAFLRSNIAVEVNEQEIDQLIAARKQAREDKDWALADEIRDQLAAMKVVVEDGADGSGWRIER